MNYVIKRAAPEARKPRSYIESDDMRQTWTASVTAYPDDDETTYIGLVTPSGDAIHKQVKQPAGFIRFEG